MKRLTCEMCGGTDIVKQDGVFVCQNCGMKYSVEEAKKMMIEGTVEVKGTVTVDNSSMVGNYLSMAQNAYNSSNQVEAEQYCNKIIEIEPTNYEAWFLKGQAAGWQSSLNNLRLPESVSAFINAINYSPDEERESIIENAKAELLNLSGSIIDLRGNRFSKWPDKDEAAGFVSDISNILAAMLEFIQQSHIIIPITEIMAPIATKINNSVIEGWNNVIEPDYKGDDGHPSDYDFKRYIERIGYCTDLLEKAIDLCEEDDAEDITRYENLISFHESAISACSYEHNYHSYTYTAGGYWSWDKSIELTEGAKQARRKLIADYKKKITKIRTEIDKKAIAEKAKKFEQYWSEHQEEKKLLEDEKNEITSKIKAIEKELAEQVKLPNKEIQDLHYETVLGEFDKKISALTIEKSNLGLFKGKQKKELQEQIEKLTSEKAKMKANLDIQIKTIESKKNVMEKEAQKKLAPLQARLNAIKTELTKDR